MTGMEVNFVISSDMRIVFGDRQALREVLHGISSIIDSNKSIRPILMVKGVHAVLIMDSMDKTELFQAALDLLAKNPVSEVDPAAIFRHVFPVMDSW